MTKHVPWKMRVGSLCFQEKRNVGKVSLISGYKSDLAEVIFAVVFVLKTWFFI